MHCGIVGVHLIGYIKSQHSDSTSKTQFREQEVYLDTV